jgi:hypothetical protein
LLYLTGLDLSSTAKSNPIVKQSSYQELPNGIWQMLLYGMTYEIFTRNKLNLQESRKSPQMELTSSTAASHNRAKISVLRDLEKAWKESEADFFSRSFAWPKKSSPRSYSLKTFRPLQSGEDFESLKKLPRWGMIVDGVLYPLQVSELCTKEKGGSYLPTPTERAAPDCPAERRRDSPSLNCVLNIWNKSHGQKTNPNYLEWMMMYPLNWTELSPLETQSCQPKLEKLFASCRALHKIDSSP